MVPDGCVRRLHEGVALPAELLRRWIDVGLRVQNVWLVEHAAIANELAVAHLERVAREPNEALHEILRRIFRPLENDDVAILWLAQLWQPAMREWHLRPVCELVHQQEVADEERAFHATARNLERLDEEGAQEEEQQHRDSQNFRPFPEEGQWPGSAIHTPQRANALLGCDRPGRGWCC